MEKFKKFIGAKVNPEKLKDMKLLNDCCLCCNSIPESIDEFEEIEYSIDDIMMCVAILEGKIKRIMLVKVDKSDPDSCSPLTSEELSDFLSRNEENLLKFFENITL